MENLPQSVRSRLHHSPEAASGEHPDANLLAAFAEGALPEKERGRLSAHLAACADCREYLALAFASEEQEAPVSAVRTGRGSWFRAWGWGLAAAATACGIIAVLRWQRPVAPAVPIATETAAVIRPAAPQQRALKPAAPAKMFRPPPAAVVPPAKTASIRANSPPPPVAQPEVAAPANSTMADQLRPEASSSPLVAAEAQKAKSAVYGGQMPSMAPAAAPGSAAQAARSAPLQWSINASPDTAGSSQGLVQNSRDGRSWQTVPLSGAVSFRAVAASGAEVWAGGSGGSLFHSFDYGAHWTPVTVAADGGKLSGDIVRIDVPAPRHVEVSSTAGEKWTTLDGGAHWTRSKQQGY